MGCDGRILVDDCLRSIDAWVDDGFGTNRGIWYLSGKVSFNSLTHADARNTRTGIFSREILDLSHTNTRID